MGKGAQTPAPTQTTQQTLSPQQQEVLNLAMPGIRSFAAQTPQRYQGQTIADFTDAQKQGQQDVLASAGAQRDIANNAARTSNFYTSGDVWNPASNPNLQGAVDAAVRPIYDNLTERALPAIRQDVISAGGFGGSRGDLAQGLASREASRAAGDTASKLVQDQYKTNVDAQLKALGLISSTQQAQAQPGLTESAVGDVQQNQIQRGLDQNVQNFNYDQYAPFLQSKELMSLVQGMPGGGTTSTGSVPPQPSSLQQALGGAATGASLGSLFGPVGTGLGALGGAAMPFLFR